MTAIDTNVLTLIDTPYAQLWYHPDTKIVHHHFESTLDSEHFRAVLNRGIELLTENDAKKWLSDNRHLKPHSEEDGEWTNSDWLPRVIAAGWKYWALVVPEDEKGRMNMVEFVEIFFNMGVRVMVFVDVAEAMKWLENVDR